MRKFLICFVTFATSMVSAWAQRYDVNGDGIINSADVVCIYNDIVNGTPRELKDEVFTVNGVSFRMIAVKGGTFQMGATSEQGDDAWKFENPIHSVTLSSYSIGQTEVTQALWKAVMGSNPSSLKGDDLPVESVSWNDCQEFIKKLNALTDMDFRLPTEAEWEYACRGGNQSNGYEYSGSDSIEDVAWYYHNSNDKTHTVATKLPNELGIYDMSGNVAEYCQDWYGAYSSANQTNPIGPNSGIMCVMRGGSWYGNSGSCRSFYRSRYSPDLGEGCIGLRLVLPVCDKDLNGDDELNTVDIISVYNRIITHGSYDCGPDKTFNVNGVTLYMVAVEGGTFQMGSDHFYGEGDYNIVHSVTLSDYYIGQTEVTQALWKAVMGNNPSINKGDNLPVENVVWDDCQEFIAKLNALTGEQFRLPTEAEWEYACRGGNKSMGCIYSGSDDIDQVAWYYFNSFKTQPVATKWPNELGIFDMSGNVYEWCQDWYGEYSSSSQINPSGPINGTNRVNRGGSIGFPAWHCCSYSRYGGNPKANYADLGLRIALTM